MSKLEPLQASCGTLVCPTASEKKRSTLTRHAICDIVEPTITTKDFHNMHVRKRISMRNRLKMVMAMLYARQLKNDNHFVHMTVGELAFDQDISDPVMYKTLMWGIEQGMILRTGKGEPHRPYRYGLTREGEREARNVLNYLWLLPEFSRVLHGGMLVEGGFEAAHVMLDVQKPIIPF